LVITTTMATLSIREKLYDFIRIADDKKVKAIYKLLEEDIVQTNEWWKNTGFTKELDNRLEAMDSGTDKGVSINELENSVDLLRKKRNGR